MRRGYRRWYHLKRFLRFLSLLLVLVFGVAYVLTNTSLGFSLLLKGLSGTRWVGGADISARVSSASLLSVSFSQLRVSKDNRQAVLSEATIQWSPRLLWHDGRLSIDHLKAKQMALVLPATTIDLQDVVAANMVLHQGELSVPTVSLTVAENHLAGQGQFSLSTGQFQAAVHQQYALRGHQLAGTLHVTGQFDAYQFAGQYDLNMDQQHRGRLKVQGSGSLSGVTLQDLTLLSDLGDVHASGQVIWRPKLTWQLHVAGDNIDLHGTNQAFADPAALQLWTAGDEMGATLFAQGDLGSLGRVSLRGGFDFDQHALVLKQFLYASPIGAWRLDNPVTLPQNSAAHMVESICLVNPRGRLCGHLKFRDGRWSGKFRSDDFQLAALNPLLLQMQLAGVGKLHLAVSGHQHHLDLASLLVDLSGAKVEYGGQDVVLSQGTLRMRYAHAVLTALLSALSHTEPEKKSNPSADRLSASLGVQFNPTNPDQSRLSGNVDVQMQQLSQLALIIPQLQRVGGGLTGQLSISGTLAKPRYRGHLYLKDGHFSLARYGTDVRDISVTVSANQTQRAFLDARGRLGEGSVRVTGQMDLALHQQQIKLNLKLNNALVANNNYMRVHNDADVMFIQTPEVRRVQGKMKIHHAVFNITKLKASIDQETDVVYVNNQGRVISRDMVIPAHHDIEATIGENVKLVGHDLNATLSGRLHLTQQPYQKTMATGALAMNGTYHIYGRTFVFEDSHLNFVGGPVEDPNLDVHARLVLNTATTGTSGFNSLTITPRIVGTLFHPSVTFLSNPPLSQEEILSYVVLGQPLSEAGNNAGPLSQAALTFVLKGGSSEVLENIRREFGLSQLSLGTLERGSQAGDQSGESGQDGSALQDNTAIFIGKTISPRLSVSYGVGLFNAQQIFKTRFTISRRWQLLTETSNLNSGADILYVIER